MDGIQWPGSKNEPFIRGNISLVEEKNCKVMQVHDETGDGVMTIHTVFPGVFVMRSDFHMDACESSFVPDCDMLCIDHCREGRMEQELGNGAYTYLGAGDMKVDKRENHTGHAAFPLRHFHGVSIILLLEQASKALPEEIRDFPVDLAALREKFCPGGLPRVIEGEPAIEHIFSDLYTVPDKIRTAYYKVKVLELLLFLDALELPEEAAARPYFYKTQVEKIKAMREMMCKDLTCHYTLEQLAHQYSLSLTALKTCFKSVYGDSVFSYMRSYRMNQAAILLRRSPQHSVATISGMVGYESPSKFSTAFKDVMGLTPLAYRNSSV